MIFEEKPEKNFLNLEALEILPQLNLMKDKIGKMKNIKRLFQNLTQLKIKNRSF